jgi:putative protease
MEKEIGKVIHYWGKISVAGINITEGELKAGDVIHIKGHTSDFTQKVDSIQIENDTVEKAKVGDSIGVKVEERVHEHDTVYLVTEE